MIDTKTLKNVYKFDNWLQRINLFASEGKTLLPDGSVIPTNKFESDELERKELDEWWWGEHYKDFSRYSTWHYLYAGLNCFFNYSRPAAFVAYEYLKDKEIKSIVDVGAGIGLSTMLLADLFPNAQVYYNNIEGSMQHEFFKLYKQDRVKFLSNDDLKNIKAKYDVLFASEYFEHFEGSSWSSELTGYSRFKYIVVSNSFNVKAYGHFKEYLDRGNIVTPRQASRIWLKMVRRDYEDMKIKCWNGRPKIFISK